LTNYTVLIANGEFPNNEYCNNILSNNPEIICVDTNQELIEKLGIKPKIILGDLDTANINNANNSVQIIKLDNQNKTDLEKAFEFCLEEKINEIVVLGATGQADDHNLANILIAYQYSKRLNIELISNYFRIMFINERKTIKAKKNMRVSMISLDTNNKISSSGLQYELKNETLDTFTKGISNKCMENEFTISAEKELILFTEIV
tara:strand:+ start:603 stop:1217 length:615 start_codon:yes stop_codon:yes gene_type:complete